MNGSPDVVLLGWVAVVVMIGLIVLFGSWFTVEQQEVAIIQRLGKFLRIARAGLNFKLPLIDQVVANVNLRVQQLTVKVETKTRDNVFVHVTVAVQFSVFPDKVYQAYYSLTDATPQITAFVFDVVRAHVPSLDLDDVFLKKDEVAQAVKGSLGAQMSEYGYDILTALVTDIDHSRRIVGSNLTAVELSGLTRVELGFALVLALTASGIATWTIEYRRVGDAGGGWPGTFLDVAQGADQLAQRASRLSRWKLRQAQKNPRASRRGAMKVHNGATVSL